MGNAVIFVGSSVKALKATLNLNNQAFVASGSDDPSVAGFDAPVGSIYLRDNGSLYVKTAAGLTSWGTAAISGGAVNFSDADFAIQNSADATKILKFNASSISTATTRTLTAPDLDGTFALGSGTRTESVFWDAALDVSVSERTVENDEFSLPAANYIGIKINSSFGGVAADAIELSFGTGPTAPEDLTIRIFDDNSGEPGTELAASDVVTVTANTKHTFPFASPVTLPSADFWIIVDTTAPIVTTPRLQADDTVTDQYRTSSDLITWSSVAFFDGIYFRFLTYGEAFLSSEAALAPSRGGRGVSNPDGSTLSIPDGNAVILQTTGATDVTLPVSGTLATLTGTETLSNKSIDNSFATLKQLTIQPTSPTVVQTPEEGYIETWPAPQPSDPPLGSDRVRFFNDGVRTLSWVNSFDSGVKYSINSPFSLSDLSWEFPALSGILLTGEGGTGDIASWDSLPGAVRNSAGASDTSLSINWSTGTFFAQKVSASFTGVGTASIEKISVTLAVAFGSDDLVRASLYTDTGTEPDALLAETAFYSVPGFVVSSLDFDFVFDFDNQPTVSNGTDYWIVLESSNNTGAVSLEASSVETAHPTATSNNGSTWTTSTSNRLFAEIKSQGVRFLTFKETLSPQDGGTGIRNTEGNTLEMVGGNSIVLNTSASTDLTLPAAGTLATTSDVSANQTITLNTVSTPIRTPVVAGAAGNATIADVTSADVQQFVGFTLDATTMFSVPVDIQTHGLLGGFSGLSAGSAYYLSGAGNISDTAPVAAGEWIVPVGVAISATEILINPNAGADAVEVGGTTGGLALEAVSGNITAQNNRHYLVDTSSSSISIQLPDIGASENFKIRVSDATFNASTNNITVTADGTDTIEGSVVLGESVVINVSDGWAEFSAVSGTSEWQIDTFAASAGTGILSLNGESGAVNPAQTLAGTAGEIDVSSSAGTHTFGLADTITGARTFSGSVTLQNGNSDGTSTLIGADGASFTITDGTNKIAALSAPHYLSDTEEPVGIFLLSNTTNANSLRIGSSVSGLNSPTEIRFYTAANNTTVAGTERMRIISSGNVGIGTPSPAGFLDVNGGTQTGGSFNSLTPSIVLSGTNDSSSVYGGIRWDFTGDSITPSNQGFMLAGLTSAGSRSMRLSYDGSTVLAVNQSGAVTLGPSTGGSTHTFQSGAGSGTRVVNINNTASSASQCLVNYQLEGTSVGFIGADSSRSFKVLRPDGNQVAGLLGSCSDTGAWTLGPSSFTGEHQANGSFFVTLPSATPGTKLFDVTGSAGGLVSFRLFEDSWSIGGSMLPTGTGNTVFWNAGSMVRQSSASRYKENIQDLTNGLSMIEALSPKTYTRKNTQQLEHGLIAEEVLGLLPELVTYEEDGQVSGLVYDQFIPFLIGAVQELNAKVESLEAQLSGGA